MSSNEVKIVRQALLNEQEAISFYTMAAGQAKTEEAKEAFLELAAEEQMHVEWLSTLYKSICENNVHSFDPTVYDEPSAPIKYDWKTIGRESGALAVSVFGIGINMEKAAIDYYTQAAQTTQLPVAKELYEKLFRWEYQHLEQFQKEYDNLREEWWDRQGFSPS